MEQTKICTHCGQEKALSAFSRHRLSKDGHAYQCKECNAVRSKIFRASPIGVYTNIKGRTGYYKRKEVYISKEDFVEWYKNQPQICEYCGIRKDQLYLLRDHFGSIKNSLTVDCKDNSLGYAKGNLTLACDKCNQVKNNILSYEDMKYVGQQFIHPKWEKWLEE